MTDSRWTVCVAATIVVGLVTRSPLTGQQPTTAGKLAAMIDETQLRSDAPEDMTLVWWIPQEFWRLSATQNPNVTETEVSEFLHILEPYTLLVVVDGKMGTFGSVEYRPYGLTHDSLSLVDGAGTRFRPLDSTEVSNDARAFTAFVLRPMFTNMLGPLGANMNAFFFPAKNTSGQPLMDPRAQGTIRAELGGRSFTWRLPLGSLLPPKYCPVDGESFNGAYQYCPRHGNRLVDKPPPPAAPSH